jgi:hypothetical protein
MNSQLIKTKILASGQTAPFTGEWINTSECRNGLVVIYASGSVVDIDLEGKSLLSEEIFVGGGVAEAYPFYSETGIGAGYASPIFFDSPITNVRLAVTAGTAPVYAYITYNN